MHRDTDPKDCRKVCFSDPVRYAVQFVYIFPSPHTAIRRAKHTICTHSFLAHTLSLSTHFLRKHTLLSSCTHTSPGHTLFGPTHYCGYVAPTYIIVGGRSHPHTFSWASCTHTLGSHVYATSLPLSPFSLCCSFTQPEVSSI